MNRQQRGGLYPSHSKDLEIDENGFQLVWYCNLYSHKKAIGNLVKIEAKTFELKKTKTLGGTLFQIIER